MWKAHLLFVVVWLCVVVCTAQQTEEEKLKAQIAYLQREVTLLNEELSSARWTNSFLQEEVERFVDTLEKATQQPQQLLDEGVYNSISDVESNAPFAHTVTGAIAARNAGLQVDRRSDLSFEEFYTKYAVGRKPVVITDYAQKTNSTPWNLEFFKTMCGDKPAYARSRQKGAKTWGGLKGGNQTNIRDFIERLEAGNMGNYYVHDWLLKSNCPKTLESWIFPKYFVQNFLHRLPEHKRYRGYKYLNWPSLFIGPKNSSSALHIDSFASNFWMLQIQGRKLWKFFDPSDRILLYEERATQSFAVDPLDPNPDKHPLYKFARGFEIILNPGDLLFVPANSPHAVFNLDDTVAIAGNYIDGSNFEESLASFKKSGLAGFRGSYAFYEDMSHPDFPKDMDMNVQDTPWVDYFWQEPAGHEDYYLPVEKQLAVIENTPQEKRVIVDKFVAITVAESKQSEDVLRLKASCNNADIELIVVESTAKTPKEKFFAITKTLQDLDKLTIVLYIGSSNAIVVGDKWEIINKYKLYASSYLVFAVDKNGGNDVTGGLVGWAFDLREYFAERNIDDDITRWWNDDYRGIFQSLDDTSSHVTLDSSSLRVVNQKGLKPTIIYGSTNVSVLNNLGNYLPSKSWPNWAHSRIYPKKDDDENPNVHLSIIVPPEEENLDEFLENILKINYPKDKLSCSLISSSSAADIVIIRRKLNEICSTIMISQLKNAEEWELYKEAVTIFSKNPTAQYHFVVYSVVIITNTDIIHDLLKSNHALVAPLVRYQSSLWTNAWGLTSESGSYLRSHDYVDIVNRETQGYFNMGCVRLIFLVKRDTIISKIIPKLKSIDEKNPAPFCSLAQNQNIFMFLDNNVDYGYIKYEY